jgi:hypothetical protein
LPVTTTFICSAVQYVGTLIYVRCNRCRIFKRTDFFVKSAGFKKTLRLDPPRCFMTEALKFQPGEIFYIKDHHHLQVFVLNATPTGKKVTAAAAGAFRSSLKGNPPSVTTAEARRGVHAVDKAAELLAEHAEVYISRTVPQDQRRGNQCTCGYWAKYGMCFHVLATDHLLGNIDLRVMLATAFPANKRRGKGRKQLVTKVEPEETLVRAARKRKERYLYHGC